MKKLTTALFILFFSQWSLAEGRYTLGEEAQDAIYHLSRYCAPAMGQLLPPGAGHWIGNTEKWDSRTQNYGYNYSVFKQVGFFKTELVGMIQLEAQKRNNAPADASDYIYICKVK